MPNMSNEVPVASTKFDYKGDSVEINIYRPVIAWLNSDEYSCRFSIVGGGINYADRSIGFDSMQSLILSLMRIGDYLDHVENIDRSLITWEGGQLIFPIFKTF